MAIGRGAEFDAFATEGCRALQELGFETVGVDSNPSAILTDPGTADRAYVEPLIPECVAAVVERERPDALLPILGGPAAVEVALALADSGLLARLDVEVIGADLAALRRDPRRVRIESVAGWKRFELTIVSDAIEGVIVCVIESLDPAGVHPGDSIAVTPAQTLSRAGARHVSEIAVGAVRQSAVATAYAQVEIAVNPRDGGAVVVAVHPTLTTSSAFAARATGIPLARIVAKLAVGLGLGEAGLAMADLHAAGRCAVKIPCWAFDEFPQANRALTGTRQSVGEAVAIGSTFKHAVQKAWRSLDGRRHHLTLDRTVDRHELMRLLAVPTPERLGAIAEAYRARWTTSEMHASTGIDGVFLDQIRELVAYEDVIAKRALDTPSILGRAKRWGFADARIAELTGTRESEIRALRRHHGIAPAFHRAGMRTFYSTYDAGDPTAPAPERPGAVVLGSGPRRIGHGAGLHHCREHAAAALAARGLDAIAIDPDPVAVSAAHRVYLEPLTLEHVLDVVEHERPRGVIAQFAGDTPLAGQLAEGGVPILGGVPEAVARERLHSLLAELGLHRVPGAAAASPSEARAVAARLGYPILVRASSSAPPRIARDDDELAGITGGTSHWPIGVEAFLEDAIPVDIDALGDGRGVLVAGVMEHIEKAAVHAGDAACALPPYSLGPDEIDRLREHTGALGRALGLVGLFGVRFALRHDAVYVLGVDPRASRTVPFVSKATGIPLARLATGLALGDPLPAIVPPRTAAVAVREAVFPFQAFPGVDVVLGPGMRSTGEAIGLDGDFRRAYLKSQLAAGARLPTAGRVWISSRGHDRRPLVMLAKRLGHLGFTLVAAGDTARVLRRHGVIVEAATPGSDERAHVVDLIRRGDIALVIDVPEDGPARDASAPARRAAVDANVPCYTTLDGAQAVLGALEVLIDPVVARAA